MKHQTIPGTQAAAESDTGSASDVSAEAAIHREIEKLGEWLVAHGLDPRSDANHAHEGSRDRLYWRYGYFVGLQQALAMLTSRGATRH